MAWADSLECSWPVNQIWTKVMAKYSSTMVKSALMIRITNLKGQKITF
jgi:hypothetical protein